MAKLRITAGPAFAAPTPVSVRMPVPTMGRPPRAMRCGQERLGVSRCSSGISSRETIVLRTFQFFMWLEPLLVRHCEDRSDDASQSEQLVASLRSQRPSPSSIILRHANAGAGAPKCRNGREQREPAGHLIFD